MKVFVYGTLMSGFGANMMLKSTKPLGIDTINGTMHDVNRGGFPGVILDTGNTVQGEVYEVEDEGVLENLDRYEGFNSDNLPASLYTRHTVQTEGGHEVLIYQYNQGVSEDTIVPNGDWRAHRRG
jgi:gamma-glutamylcyclotransferase (GGCT)/AIG2-like uncharacterized protein YtfP